MSFSEILSNLSKIAEQAYEKAKQWKAEHGGKVVGLCGMHYPEELVHASGALPIILQEIDEPVTTGHAYYYPFFCGFSRSIIDQAAKGYLDFLDGFISGDYCIQVVGAGEALGVVLRKASNMFFRFPVGNQPWTQADIKEGLQELKRDLEKFVGHEITDESIRESIRVYNRNRSLMREIYRIRASNPEALSAKDLVTIVKTSMIMPKEEHNAILQELLKDLPSRETRADQEGLRVFVSGSLCGAPKVDILTMLEQTGAVVVDDDLFHGYRYINTDIDIDGNTDPLKAIASFYIAKNAKVPCPTRVDPTTSWQQYLVNAAKEHGAGAIIILMAKYCEPHMFFYPDIKETLEEAGIPHLLIEVEHEVVSLESLRTRIEAFVEIVEIEALKKGKAEASR
ncbi:MAG TPA: 2-hydroxyacyl-CoA dehydratase [Syntrophothermus lipocalidus]|uniref:Benzoyl-CoA reductase n=1 Tax=Syntrophothermus lipocalidus (strain DSM 12680 / TGB-C1) TaxID=643648 RepID=D7CKL6_SYNLT|nr:2-hydroxyacyl-CoA dehydratase family protein [Syntrophothermus lipocalidus]ADI01251.1 Benzoyl-CoA reductase [Syntrophothermus lipocalidus DSM 12680]HHV76387.1 2-hydroxyacyl-CoA dehydratase [Syntrophothermus lipocalidus]